MIDAGYGAIVHEGSCGGNMWLLDLIHLYPLPLLNATPAPDYHPLQACIFYPQYTGLYLLSPVHRPVSSIHSTQACISYPQYAGLYLLSPYLLPLPPHAYGDI